MTDQPAPEQPLHIRQAEGLRRLADMIENNPDVAPTLFSAFYMFGVCVQENARARLASLYAALKTAGAEPRIDNKQEECRVSGRFGAFRIYAWASPESMKDGTRPKLPAYEPLVVED